MYWNHSDIKNVYLHKYLSLCSTFFSFSGENRNYVDLDRLNFRRSLTINWNWIFCFRCKTFRLPSVKMGQNLTFEVNFLCQKSSESFLTFLLKNTNLGAHVMILTFLQFWVILLLKWCPIFDSSQLHQF